ncbi:hypothetical protein EMIT0P265_200035 [Pseudomonas zeae]
MKILESLLKTLPQGLDGMESPGAVHRSNPVSVASKTHHCRTKRRLSERGRALVCIGSGES